MREKIPKAESASKLQFKDYETAENISEKAMERLKETKALSIRPNILV